MIEALSSEFSTNFNVNHRCHCHLQRTPAHYATAGGHKNALEKLIHLGADLNIGDERGRTCLDYALETKHDELAIWIPRFARDDVGSYKKQLILFKSTY